MTSSISDTGSSEVETLALRLDGHETIWRERHEFINHRFDEIARTLGDLSRALERHDREFERVDRDFEKVYREFWFQRRILVVIGALVVADFFGIDWAMIVEFLKIVT
ncbi:MAG: hypothetical protein MPK06_03925 [Alphaproteobacteria bacterium]|nr:hypothetical protein [Alphaproteobacteria bacterium]MDA7987666.1 hypothetical protein [Alphaproteobacteria bacterium]MDA8000392.1 hypothetical protein [Alphaproteobacteria bacterium]MDA8003764.1 hypothetical protein [Alphaproteobacteria bacterium]MDA8005672.1 hypothetical protein [Alphaproteobacteria bacterium]